jgi:hypothetical protein
MLLAEVVPSPSQKSQRYLCLDLLDASFQSVPPIQADAILVEVWPAGGLLHVECATPLNCNLCLTCPAGVIQGKVISCDKDETGFIVEFAVAENQQWFPEVYSPPYLLPAPQAPAPKD